MKLIIYNFILFIHIEFQIECIRISCKKKDNRIENSANKYTFFGCFQILLLQEGGIRRC